MNVYSIIFGLAGIGIGLVIGMIIGESILMADILLNLRTTYKHRVDEHFVINGSVDVEKER